MTGFQEPPPAPTPRGLADAMIAVPVHCCRCTYDLRGLAADGRCPECGLEIFYTLQHTVDPAASRLPKLRDPRGVGNAIVWLVFCCLIAACLLITQTLLAWTEIVAPTQVVALGMVSLLDLIAGAAVAVLLGLWSAHKFKPKGRNEHDAAVRVDLWILTCGLASCGVLLLGMWQRERYWAFNVVPVENIAAGRAWFQLFIALAAVLIWVGMQRVLSTIGRRSRAYRRAKGGRQNIRPMIFATAGAAVGSALRLVDVYVGPVNALTMMGTVIISVCWLMVLIGLAYLLINAWWIRQSLRNPPPRLEDLLRRMP